MIGDFARQKVIKFVPINFVILVYSAVDILVYLVDRGWMLSKAKNDKKQR